MSTGQPGKGVMALVAIHEKKIEGVESVFSNREVREATTGRVVAVIPTLWATAGATAEEVSAPGSGVRARGTTARTRPKPELAFYRKYTEAMLRRYVQMSMEAGRVPSMLGREMFRGKVTSYRVRSFEDVVIFRLDVERCLTKLDETELGLVKRIALQEYTQGEAAMLVGMSLRACVQRYGEALDRLTGMFLQCRMLEPLEGCQEAEL